jgi:outer membrane murein-binding lipoprotein Lpp
MSNNLLAGTVSALFAKVDVLESDATRVRKELEEARAHAEQLELRRVQLDDAEEEHRQHFRKLYTYVLTMTWSFL